MLISWARGGQFGRRGQGYQVRRCPAYGEATSRGSARLQVVKELRPLGVCTFAQRGGCSAQAAVSPQDSRSL